MAQDTREFDDYDVVGERHWNEFTDIGYSVWASKHKTYSDTHVQFHVYEIVASDVTEGDHSYPRGYQRAGATSSSDIVEDRLKADVFLRGSVKWDGCSNWEFPTQDQCMLHFCDKQQAANLGVLMSRLYEWAKELGMDRL